MASKTNDDVGLRLGSDETIVAVIDLLAGMKHNL
jgi:hypothetical protein